MKKQLIGALGGIILFSTSAFAEECVAPEAPVVPERFESQEQLMATYGEVKTYITEKSPEYLDCLDRKREGVNPDADNADEKIAAIDQAYNDNVDSQNATNNRFKAAHEIWKKENPE